MIVGVRIFTVYGTRVRRRTRGGTRGPQAPCTPLAVPVLLAAQCTPCTGSRRDEPAPFFTELEVAMIAREVATAMLTGGARCSWFLTVLALSAVVAGQQGSEGDGCADHAGCGTGLYCTRAEECGLCRDDDEQPCQLWADSIDGSCTVCGDSSDPTPGSTDASAIAPEPSITDNDAGRELRRTERKAGRRKAGRRNQAAQKRSAADDTRIDERSVALPNFVAVSGAFNTDEVDRLRREGALVPAVHSNAGVQGKRNMGTKESEIRGLSRERFGWVYDKMRKLVHEANAAHW